MNTKCESPKLLIRTIGTAFSWTATSIFFVIFYAAAINPEHQLLLNINASGGMGIIAIALFSLIWIAATMNLILAWKSDRGLHEFMGATFSWAFTSLLSVMFITALLNPAHQLLIDVNAYGEMGIEIVIFGIIWIATTTNMALTWKPSKQYAR